MSQIQRNGWWFGLGGLTLGPLIAWYGLDSGVFELVALGLALAIVGAPVLITTVLDARRVGRARRAPDAMWAGTAIISASSVSTLKRSALNARGARADYTRPVMGIQPDMPHSPVDVTVRITPDAILISDSYASTSSVSVPTGDVLWASVRAAGGNLGSKAHLLLATSQSEHDFHMISSIEGLSAALTARGVRVVP